MAGLPADTDVQGQTPQRGARRLLARFRRAQDGATIIEFAIVLTPFLMLMFAIMETALMFWTSQMLEEAVTQTSRSLVTGKSQTRYAGTPTANAAAFRNDICAQVPTALINCSKLAIDVRTYSTFASASSGTSASNPVQGGSLNTNGFGFQQPQPKQIVVVRAALEYTLFFTQWSTALANIGTGKRAIMASATFRAEPFVTPST